MPRSFTAAGSWRHHGGRYDWRLCSVPPSPWVLPLGAFHPGDILKYFPGLTAKMPTDGVQGGKTDRFGFVAFEDRKVRQSQPDLLRQLGQGDLALEHDPIQVYSDTHCRTFYSIYQSDRQILFLLHLCADAEDFAEHQEDQAGEDTGEIGIQCGPQSETEHDKTECHPAEDQCLGVLDHWSASQW